MPSTWPASRRRPARAAEPRAPRRSERGLPCGHWVLGFDPFDLAQRRAERRAAADRVGGRLAQDQVEVGAVRAVWGIARQPELGALLPPAVLAADDSRVKGRVEPRA